MNDSFSQFAKQIRQNKIDKNEIRNIKKEVEEINMKKSYKNKMIIIMQKYIRGFLYRKKYKLFLEQMNTETVIDYLLENRRKRIHEHSEEIISFFVLKYIKKQRKKLFLLKKKIYSINLIKSRLRGIISRKKYKAKLAKIKRSKKLILKYTLSYKVRLILRSDCLQNILNEIANIKLALKNIDKSSGISGQDIFDLKMKLNKNLNNFYTTYYQLKDDNLWVKEEKIERNWILDYLNILKGSGFQKRISQSQASLNNKKEELFNLNSENKEKNIYVQKKDIYKNNNKNNRNNKFLFNNNKNSINESSMSNRINMSNIKQNNYSQDESFENSIFKTREIEKEKEKEKGKETEKKNLTTHYTYKKILSPKIINKYINLKTDNNFFINDIQNKEMNNSKLNNNINNTFNKNFVYIKKKDLRNSEKINSTNILRVNKKEINNENISGIKTHNMELQIKPIKVNSFKNIIIKSPTIKRSIIFGSPKRNINYELNDIKHSNIINASAHNNNNKIIKYSFSNTNTNTNTDTIENIIDDEDFTIEVHKIKKNPNERKPNYNDALSKRELIGQETPIQKEKTRILNYKEIFGEHRKGEDQPIGTKKINYDLLFNQDEVYVEEEEPIKVKRKKNANYKPYEIHKKKIVYDARKAIEQAKIKEATEDKKERPSAFREFLKEMKKLNNEEKEKELKKNKDNENNNNKDITDNNVVNKIDTKVIRINRNKKLSKQVESFFDENDINEINEQSNNILITDTQEKLPNEDNNINLNMTTGNKKVKYMRKIDSKEIISRKRLHDLERSPAPRLNIKRVKSRINCWSGSEEKSRIFSRLIDTGSNRANFSYVNQKEIIDYINSKKLKQVTNNINRIIKESSSSKNILVQSRSKQLNISDNKIEKYVYDRLRPLNVELEKLNNIFSIEKYFKDKYDKMKSHSAIPYIKEEYNFVKKYTKEEYNKLIPDIEAQYKLLK